MWRNGVSSDGKVEPVSRDQRGCEGHFMRSINEEKYECKMVRNRDEYFFVTQSEEIHILCWIQVGSPILKHFIKVSQMILL